MTRSTNRTKQERWRQRYGPWALVTGASDGIGREAAICLARAGLDIVLCARRKEILEALALDLSARHRIQVRVVTADLTQRSGVAALIEATADLDVGLLFAAAGFGTSGDLIDSNLENELEMLAVNCSSVLVLTRHFGARLAERRRGGIILMSSIVAFQGVPHAASYGATKAYVQSLAEGLRQELAPFGVDVLASAPGPVHSGFARRANMQMGAALEPRDVAQPTLDALGRKATVRPGWLSKVLGRSLSTLPRWGRVKVMGRIMGGMAKQRQ